MNGEYKKSQCEKGLCPHSAFCIQHSAFLYYDYSFDLQNL